MRQRIRRVRLRYMRSSCASPLNLLTSLLEIKGEKCFMIELTNRLRVTEEA